MPDEYVDAFFDFYVGRTSTIQVQRPRRRSSAAPAGVEQWAAAHADAFR